MLEVFMNFFIQRVAFDRTISASMWNFFIHLVLVKQCAYLHCRKKRDAENKDEQYADDLFPYHEQQI